MRIGAVIGGFVVAGCAAMVTSPQPGDLERTWTKAERWMPKSQSEKIPVVFLIHGCTGLTDDSRWWGQTLAQAGFAVIAPDSFARSYRPVNCDPQSRRVFDIYEVRLMRREEIRYAFAQVKSLSWVDQDRVFLFGHSEGGAATATFNEGGFRGYVISGISCRGGLFTPKLAPVLYIRFETDPWYPGGTRCPTLEQYPFGREVVISGHGHNAAASAEARDAVVSFLKEWKK